MKQILLTLALSALSLAARADVNRRIHCYNHVADIYFHTVIYGTMAVGDKALLNGNEMDLPDTKLDISGPLEFNAFNHNFLIDGADGNVEQMNFTLIPPKFTQDPNPGIGICEEI